MPKIIEINTISKKALKNLLPSGAFREIESRLKKQGNEVHYNTIVNAFREDSNITDKHELVIREAITYYEELKAKRRMKVSDDVAEALSATGS